MMRAALFAAPFLVACAACHGPTSSAASADTTTAAAVAEPAAASSSDPKFVTKRTDVGTDPGHAGRGTPLTPGAGHALAAFAEGCFWGSENTFRHVDGVVATAVGYAGGHTPDPDYEKVCTHTTGYAETVLVEYDPQRVSYAQLLHAFWDTHDPTTLNRQGPDFGDQYRSEVFTFTPEQATEAHASMQEEQKKYGSPITTLIQPMPAFYKAEDYHQQYDEKTGRESCPLPRKRGA
jgi:peptide-methionine (S)-S-oxide reductase